MKNVTAIVPAAGLSSRFGGANKLLQPWGDSTVIRSTVRTLLDSGLWVTVVTGRDSDLVEAELSSMIHESLEGVSDDAAVESGRGLLGLANPLPVFNPNWEADGLGRSIAMGVAASAESDGYLIALADMPGLNRGVVQALLRAFEQATRHSIVAPVYESEPDRTGHPVLFGADYREALAALTGDEGARSVLSRNRDRLITVSVPGWLGDIDTPEDLKASERSP